MDEKCVSWTWFGKDSSDNPEVGQTETIENIESFKLNRFYKIISEI